MNGHNKPDFFSAFTGHQNAFTLIEIIVSMGIIIIGIMSIFAILPAGQKNVQSAGDYSIAAILAEMKIAEILYCRDTSLGSAPYPVSFPDSGLDPAPFSYSTNISGVDKTKILKFHWHYDVFSVPTNSNLYRVNLLIYEEEDRVHPLKQTVTYMTKTET